MIKKQPTVTVVTVCYNAAASIRETMKSVLMQTYPAIEYLVIDGCSSDNTMQIVHEMAPQFFAKGIQFRFFCEKDKGIYDAMNKGIRMATGKWINFMNAGDGFIDADVLTKTFDDDPEEILLYGDAIYQMNFGNLLLKPKNIDALRSRMAFCHQSVFMPTREMKAHPFADTYRIAGDYKFFYDYYNRGGKFRYLNYPISYFESEQGISSVNILESYRERAHVRSEHLSKTWKLKYSAKCLSYHFKENVKHVFPDPLVESVREWNYRRKMMRRLAKQKLSNT